MDEDKLVESVAAFVEADGLKKDDAKEVLERLKEHAGEKGFSETAVARLVDVVVGLQKRSGDRDTARPLSNQLSRLSGDLVKALSPNDRVPEGAVLALLGPMMSFTHSVQLECLNWLALVFDVVDGERTGSRGEDRWQCAAFNICFFLTVYDTLRPAACYLLCRLTKSHHASNFRVRHLQNLQARVGVERELTAVLMAFKHYNQAVVIREKQKRSNLVFKNPGRVRLETINRMRSHVGKPPLQFWSDVAVSKAFAPMISRNSDSKSKRSLNPLPSVSVSQKSISGKRIGLHTQTITSISDVSRGLLWASAENSQPPLPSQMIATITSRPLLHTLQLYRAIENKQSKWMVTRVSDWLHFRLVESGRQGEAQLGEMLLVLQYLTIFLQEMPAPLEDWLHRFLCGWDGIRHRAQILDILARLRPMPFETLYWNFLKPLHPLLAAADAGFKAALLRCLCEMLAGFARFDWLSITHLQSSKPDEPHHLGPLTFEGIELGVDYVRTIRSLLVYTNSVTSMSLLQHPNNLLIQHEALCLQEEMSRLWSRYALPFLVPPPIAVVYSCLLSTSSMACSRMCGVLSMIKGEIEKLRPSRGRSGGADDFELTFPSGLDDESIKRLNSFILDFCNALWRSRLGEDEKKNSQGSHWPFFSDGNALKVLSMRYPGMTTKSVFSITKLVSFSACVHNFLEQKGASHIGDEMKQDFLAHLNESGYVGAHDFIYTFIASFERLRRAKGEKR